MSLRDDTTMRAIQTRGLTALVLAAAHLALRPAITSDDRHRVVAALIAAAAPTLIVARALRRSDVRWSVPRSPAGRALLVGYVGVGVLVEELAWRAPLLHLRPGRVRRGVALASGAAFGAVHLRRDGMRSAPVHLANTTGWTVATLVGGRLRYALIAHTLYNVAALSLRTVDVAATHGATHGAVHGAVHGATRSGGPR